MTRPTVRFAVVRMNHHHIYAQVDMLLAAGGELDAFYAPEAELAGPFATRYPQARRAATEEEVLEDAAIQLVVTSAIPCDRAPLGIRVMRCGKDFQTDKPGFTTLEQLAAVRQVQAETGRIYSISYNERLQVRAAVKAGELIRQGAIGPVLQMTGLGPHRVNPPNREPWFFDPKQYGGILADIASHQFDQFLYYTGSTEAVVVASQVGNLGHPEHPGLEDFGDVMLRGDGGLGYIRVDWFTPQGLGVWGDGRTFVLGADGYIELRKYIDVVGRPGGDHLFLVDHHGAQHIDCSGVKLPYGRQLLDDIVNRTETAQSQSQAFLASELALTAQARAMRVDRSPLTWEVSK
jgi:predicted dehydrogenase